jgi:hypothetical protein
MLRRLEHFCSFHATGAEIAKITGFQAFRRFAAVRYALLRSAVAKAPPRLGALPEGLTGRPNRGDLPGENLLTGARSVSSRWARREFPATAEKYFLE